MLSSGACAPSPCPVAGAISSLYYLQASSSVIVLCDEQVVDSTAELLTFVHTASTTLDIDVSEQNKEDHPETAQVHHHRLIIPFAVHVAAYGRDWHMGEWEVLGHLQMDACSNLTARMRLTEGVLALQGHGLLAGCQEKIS